MKLYHLTTKHGYKKIISQGILPKCGKNTRWAEGTEDKFIFLCEEKDIDIWAAFLKRDYVIELEIDPDKYEMLPRTFCECLDGGYKEYYTSMRIPKKCIVNSYKHKLGKIDTISEHTKIILENYLKDYLPELCYNFFCCSLSSFKGYVASEELAFVAKRPIKFYKYLENSKKIYKDYVACSIKDLKSRVDKERDTEVKENLRSFIDYMENAC